MPRVYELPTHLQVEDDLIAGLTARQMVRLMIGGSLAYGLWDQAVWMPTEVRLLLAVVIVVGGLAFALLRPGGRPLDQWLLAGVLFAVLPRRLVWRPSAIPVRNSRRQEGWAELEVRPEWLHANPVRNLDEPARTPGPPGRKWGPKA
jgi:hypothetical protein